MPTASDEPNLIDMGQLLISPDFSSRSVFELFDPLRQSNRPHSWPAKLDQAGTTSNNNSPPFVTPNNETPPALPSVTTVTSSASSLYPYPIQLRLKLTTFPEIKPFSQLVQRIRDETLSKEVKQQNRELLKITDFHSNEFLFFSFL